MSGFDRVSVSGAGELTLAQGDQESLTIETDDNLLPLIRSDVQGGHLAIGPQNVNLRPTRTIRYQLTLKHLSALQLSGSVRAEATSLKTERLALGISGSGHASLWVDQTLKAHISGSGGVEYRGNATVDSHVSGSGQVHHQGGKDPE